MRITNFKLRITDAGFWFRNSLFLCLMFVFSVNISGQNTSITQEQIDLLPYAGIFENPIHPQSVERKRTALLELRNFRTANASRLAVPALNDSSEIVRATAVFSVIFLPKEEAAQNLLPLLADKKPLVRREAAYALGAVGDPKAVVPLQRLFQKDKVPEVRNAAVVALGAIGDVSAVAELVRILERKPNVKEDFQRRSAARSIGQIAQIIQTGETEVVTPQKFSPVKPEKLPTPPSAKLNERFPVFRAATSVLIQMLQSSNEADDARREAAFALGAIGDESAAAVLQSNINAEDYYLAEICRESLLKLKRD